MAAIFGPGPNVAATFGPFIHVECDSLEADGN